MPMSSSERAAKWARAHREQVNAYNREYRKRNPEKAMQWAKATKEWRAAHPDYEKSRNRVWPKTEYTPYPKVDRKLSRLATWKLNYAVLTGLVTKLTHCQWCGSPKRIEGHHASYSEDMFLVVTWLCRSCHSKLHKGFWR